MPALKDPNLESYCQERAKVGATDISAYVAGGYDVKDPKAYETIKRILKNEKVSLRIAEIHVEAAQLSGVTPPRVIQQLADIAFTDIGKVVEWGSTVVRSHVDKVSGERRVVIERKNWMRLIDSSKTPPLALAAVDKISRNADGSLCGVRMRSPMPALVALGKHLGMFPDATTKRKSAAGVNRSYQHQSKVFVDRGPPETREEWEARQKLRFAKIDAAGELKTDGGPQASN